MILQCPTTSSLLLSCHWTIKPFWILRSPESTDFRGNHLHPPILHHTPCVWKATKLSQPGLKAQTLKLTIWSSTFEARSLKIKMHRLCVGYASVMNKWSPALWHSLCRRNFGPKCNAKVRLINSTISRVTREIRLEGQQLAVKREDVVWLKWFRLLESSMEASSTEHHLKRFISNDIRCPNIVWHKQVVWSNRLRTLIGGFQFKL